MQETATDSVMPQHKRRTAFRIDRLKWARQQKQLSQCELGLLAHIACSQINRYESGVIEPAPAQLVMLTKALDCSVDWLLGVSDDPESPQRNAQALSSDEKLILERHRRGEFVELIRDFADKELNK